MNTVYGVGFKTQSNEIQRQPTTITGQIPTWLSGTLIRNGPAKFEVGSEQYRHWFDGLAMLHRFAFQEGRVFYSNRFLRSGAFDEAAKAGRIMRDEFATSPQRSWAGRLWSLFFARHPDNACVNVSVIDGVHVAMTETPDRIGFNPTTLETLGPFEYSDNLKGQLSTAHPHYDVQSREVVNFVTHIARKSAYHIYRIKDGQRRREILATVLVEEPGYMHSFAMTENYVILVEYPLVARPLDLLLGRKPFIENFVWKPHRGTRFVVIDRHGQGIRGIYQSEPFFAFHHINAYEESEGIILDMAAYRDKSIIDAFYLDRLRGAADMLPLARLSRMRISLSGGSVSREPLMDPVIELPRINDRTCNTKRHRFVYGVSRTEAANGIHNRLVKADLEAGQLRQWFEGGCFPGEPVFVARPDTTAEDDGVILSVVLDVGQQKSYLLVLEAHGFHELARAQVPQHIPFGFHGQFYADESRQEETV